MGLQTGIFSDLIGHERSAMSERRSSLENPSTSLAYPAEWLLDVFSGSRTDSGVRVSEMTAFQCSTFLSCVDLIAGSISTLDMHVYERSVNGRGRLVNRIAYDHELYETVSCEPNDEMTQTVMIKAFMCHCLAWPAGAIEIQRNAGNGVVALWPRNPNKTKPFRLTSATRLEAAPWRPFPVVLNAGTLAYKTTDNQDDVDTSESAERIVPAEDMIYIPGLSFDGRIGQSVVSLARNVLGLALATEKFGAKYFGNFAKPGGILELPPVAPGQREQSKQSWIEAQGGENSHRVAVMPVGAKFTAISNNPEESQTIETRKHVRTDIAAMMHVPPRMVGDVDSKGKSNTEQEAREFVQYAIEPWTSLIRQEFKRKLFPHRGIGRTPKNRFFVDFDFSKMLRPDAASREKFNASGRQWGYLSANDVRANEGLNPIDEPWADEYLIPVNMTLATTPVNPQKNMLPAADGTKPAEDAPKQEDIAA
jgi:HK97 family phage portal protein